MILSRDDRKNIVLIILFVLVLLLPFITKPFNVDDPFYIKTANQIITDPLRPYSFSINWSGQSRDVWKYNEATFPPLIPFYIAAVIKLFGSGEIELHLLFLPFALIAALSMYFLSKKYTDLPFFSTLLFVSVSTFLVSSSGIMLDIPMLAFLLAGLTFYIYGIDKEKTSLIVSGMVIFSLAILTKYTALIFFLIFIYCSILAKKPRFILYLIIPAMVFLIWCLHNFIIYGSLHFFSSSQHIGKGISLHKMIAVLAFLSGSLIFPVFSVLNLKAKKELYFLTLFLVLCLLGSFLLFKETGLALEYFVLSFSSLVFIYMLLKNLKFDNKFLNGWIILGLFIVIFFEPWTAARYFLIVLPPLVIIFVRMFCDRKRVLAASIVLTLIFGMLVNLSDFIWARTYPGIADSFLKKGYSNGYFAGHMGLQYYLEKTGMQALEVDKYMNPDKPYLVIARVPDPQSPDISILNKLDLVESIAVSSGFPVRVMNQQAHAGFYSSFWGVFPFVFSSKPLDEIVVYRVK